MGCRYPLYGTVSVYCTLPPVRGDVGVKVTVFASVEIENVPGTAVVVPAAMSINELVVNDPRFIGFVN